MTVYKWTLPKDFHGRLPVDTGITREFHDESGKTWLTIHNDEFIISKGYSWDGCSPKWKVGKAIFGTWDGHRILHDHYLDEDEIFFDIDQELKYASLVHDAFCQFFDQLPVELTREIIDKRFYDDCKAVKFWLSWLYYQAVRFYSKNIREKWK